MRAMAAATLTWMTTCALGAAALRAAPSTPRRVHMRMSAPSEEPPPRPSPLAALAATESTAPLAPATALASTGACAAAPTESERRRSVVIGATAALGAIATYCYQRANPLNPVQLLDLMAQRSPPLPAALESGVPTLVECERLPLRSASRRAPCNPAAADPAPHGTGALHTASTPRYLQRLSLLPHGPRCRPRSHHRVAASHTRHRQFGSRPRVRVQSTHRGVSAAVSRRRRCCASKSSLASASISSCSMARTQPTRSSSGACEWRGASERRGLGVGACLACEDQREGPGAACNRETCWRRCPCPRSRRLSRPPAAISGLLGLGLALPPPFPSCSQIASACFGPLTFAWRRLPSLAQFVWGRRHPPSRLHRRQSEAARHTHRRDPRSGRGAELACARRRTAVAIPGRGAGMMIDSCDSCLAPQVACAYLMCIVHVRGHAAQPFRTPVAVQGASSRGRIFIASSGYAQPPLQAPQPAAAGGELRRAAELRGAPGRQL